MLLRERHDHFHYYPDLTEVRVEIQELRDLITKHLDKQLEAIMATRQEVRDDIQDVLMEVRETRGAAESAIAWAKGLLDQIENVAADAADLDEFRRDLAMIKDETQATEDALKAAIPANPA